MSSTLLGMVYELSITKEFNITNARRMHNSNFDCFLLLKLKL